MSDFVRPHRQQPTRLPRPWDSPGENTGVGCHFLLQCMQVKSESQVAQSCPTLSDPMDCSPSGSSIHGIFQARVQKWVAIEHVLNTITIFHHHFAFVGGPGGTVHWSQTSYTFLELWLGEGEEKTMKSSLSSSVLLLRDHQSCCKGTIIIFNHCYWSIADLQCCVIFCCTLKWISHTYPYVPSFLDFFPM